MKRNKRVEDMTLAEFKRITVGDTVTGRDGQAYTITRTVFCKDGCICGDVANRVYADHLCIRQPN